jgi:hypothetical protein
MIYPPMTDKHVPQVEFYRSYFGIKAEACPSYLYSNESRNEVDVYVITFNNPFLVEYQVKTLRRFFKSPFNIIVVDNNNWLHPETSNDVLELCIREGITYLKAPDNYYQHEQTFDPTMKLGTTMNWLFLNCVRERKPKYFGFLDHDCFLVKEFDIRPYLDGLGMYGKVIRSQKSAAWCMHVITNFYRLDFVGDRVLDFRASWKYALDTGGANYDVLNKDFNADDYEIEHHSIRFAEQDVNRKDSTQHYEMLDDDVWYHMGASSHDQLAGDGLFKLAYTKGFLDSRLSANERNNQ